MAKWQYNADDDVYYQLGISYCESPADTTYETLAVFVPGGFFSAVEGVSDAVLGSMCWCPITNLDSADEAYEWMMGSTRSGLSDEEQQISDRLAEAFAAYINSAGIKDPDGNTLSLEESTEGIYQAGSYYDYMKSEVERSLNNFLSDTEFPYDASASSGGGMGGPREDRRPWEYRGCAA